MSVHEGPRTVCGHPASAASGFQQAGLSDSRTGSHSQMPDEFVKDADANWHGPVRPQQEHNMQYSNTVLAVSDKQAEEDEEDKKFYKSVPLAQRINQRYVKEHLGRLSDRRTARGHYSNDLHGRYTYKGVEVDNGGYRRGKLVDIYKEKSEFGPGDPWYNEVSDSEVESIGGTGGQPAPTLDDEGNVSPREY